MSTTLEINDLWKEYRLGVIGHGTLTRDLQSWWARTRGKEDPNSIIPNLEGQENQIEGDRFWALKRVSFEVREGEALGIIGKNGAGKSTLLKILSRVTAPTRGNIKVRGRIASLLEVGTGFHPELTGKENIFMNGAILGMTKQEVRSKLDEIIDFSGVESFIDTPVKRYSSGMRVRLGFAVAAHLEPEILIIDEVLAVGDADFQKKCLGKMSSIASGGKTILFVSHNMNSINNLCDRCLLMANGESAVIGKTFEIIDEYLSMDGSDAETSAVIPDKEDNIFQLLAGSILVDDSAPPNGIIQVDKPFTIKLRFKLGKNLSGGYGTFTIRNQRDEVVFFSDSRDFEVTDNLERKGIVEMNIVFPSPLLVPGKYSLSMALAKQGAGAIDWHKNLIQFEIVDTQGIRGNRSGVIYKPLHWEVERRFDL